MCSKYRIIGRSDNYIEIEKTNHRQQKTVSEKILLGIQKHQGPHAIHTQRQKTEIIKANTNVRVPHSITRL